MKRNDIKILLLQLRKDKYMQDQELKSVLRSGNLQPHQVDTLNCLEQTLHHDELMGYQALVIGGSGDYSVFDELEFKDSLETILQSTKDTQFPVLGSCWGAQFMAMVFGGKVETDIDREEVGSYQVKPTQEATKDPLFFDAPKQFWAQIGHHQSITKIPEGTVNLVSSERCEIQAFTWPGSNQYALQLHSDLNKDELIERVIHYREAYAADPALFNYIIDNAKETPYTDDLIGKFIDRIVLPHWGNQKAHTYPARK